MINVFSDASKKAIAAVAFVQMFSGSEVEVGFLIGKPKLDPSGGTTIFRLELCGAVLATNLYNYHQKPLYSTQTVRLS